MNDEDRASRHFFDLKTLKAAPTWKLAPGEGATGIAVDQDHHRIFAACGNENLIVLNSDTGKVVATPPIGEVPGAVAFEVAPQTLFV